MREIKFRAWDKKENKMQQVVQILYGHEASNYPLSVDFFRSVKSRLIKDIELMQYTGLKDKNGKEIYEGDILFFGSVDEGCGDTYEVMWVKNGFKARWIHTGKEYFEELDDTFEVIGNIYENKELLK
jgi:uncharacterized phage protein (TIGR01671 family)